MAKAEISASPGGREIIITYVIDAPKEKVWEAYSDPDKAIRWMGPRRLKGRVDEWELKEGGRYAFTHTDEDGTEYGFQGYNIILDAPNRSVRTFEFLGVPGHVSLETLYLEEEEGKTKIRTVSVFETPEDRDGMMQSGMETGVQEGFERLEELLAKN